MSYTFFPHSKSFLRGLFTLIEFLIINCVDLIQNIIRSVCFKYAPTVLNCIWMCDIWVSLSGEYEDYDQVVCDTFQYVRYLYAKLHGFLSDPVQWFQKWSMVGGETYTCTHFVGKIWDMVIEFPVSILFLI